MKVHTLQAWVIHDPGKFPRYMLLPCTHIFSGLFQESVHERVHSHRNALRKDWLRKWMGPYSTFTPFQQSLNFISMVGIYVVHTFGSPADLWALRSYLCFTSLPQGLDQGLLPGRNQETQEMFVSSCYFNTFFFFFPSDSCSGSSINDLRRIIRQKNIKFTCQDNYR